MKIAVWDTYVTRKDGKIMHFDILVPKDIKDEQKIYEYGQLYLQNKEVITTEITSKECNYCHVEEASAAIIRTINKRGFDIVELENCV